MTELPTGTVTFLFTDLVGSSRLWEEHPDAMRDALAHHDAILREAVAASGGHVVKTTGDGIHAVFATAHDALDAAVAMQQRLASEPFGETGPLRVRMGVHTCEAQHREGDYFGSEVNRAARLMSVAHGGQIVVSSITSGLVPDGSVVFIDLGEHGLRDLSRPERVFQVSAPGLDREFPPLHSLDAYQTNLPIHLSSFIGRTEELAAVAKALTEWRLVTLTGVGGVGKTRLATQVGAELLASFADGVWLCELAAAGTADEVTQRLAATLGVSQRPGMSLEASVADFLRSGEALLVLDNCEHVLDAVGRLADTVLQQCPDVKVLATSREGLAIEGERVWPVRSLATPASGDDLSAVVASDAVRLFADRAELVRPAFAIDETNVGAVGEICRRLDGIPLAIELAAARLVAMGPAQIANLLDERFRLLSGRRTSLERHQTLRAAVEWSYSLLSEPDRVVFARLGVFVGSFDLDAAKAVTGSDGFEMWDVIDALTSLVTKSMVISEDSLDGTARYSMLETLRQYARERLEATGDAEPSWRRHAEHYAAFAERAAPELGGAGELVWRPRILGELDNFCAAIAWALDSGSDADDELAVRIVAALADLSGNNRSAGLGALAERVAPLAQNAPPGRRAAALAVAAMAANSRGDYETALSLSRDAVRDGLPTDCPVPYAPHAALSGLLAIGGKLEEALEVVAVGRRLLGDIDGPLSAQAVLAAIEVMWNHSLGRVETAGLGADTALRLARESRNPKALAWALYTLGLVSALTDVSAALDALDESVALTNSGAGDIVSAMALALAAQLRSERGEPDSLPQLRDAIRWGHNASSREQLATLFDYSIMVLAGLDCPGPSAVLAGFVDHGPGGVRSVVARSEHDPRSEAIERARAALGDQRFEAAIHRGAAMSYEEIGEYTLQVLDDLINETNQTRTT
jgi:predicted ATPase/class 3 adenylate cyclase